MEIEIKDLLSAARLVQTLGVRIGWPDDPTPVHVSNPTRFLLVLDAALRAFRNLRGAEYLVAVDVNSYHRSVWIRFVQHGSCLDRNGKVESALEPSFQSLRAVLASDGGELHYWGGNNYFDVSLPFCGQMREEFPDVNSLEWDDRYRCLLERATWQSLRERVFRFSKFAESFAVRCAVLRLSRVLIPSVGICVHPWMFADCGLSVIATDAAGSALAALANPNRWPKLFSRSAFDRWDIAVSASFATQCNPDHFEAMPDLEDEKVRTSLQRRIQFAIADWTELPVASQSIDAIFATNALPRDSVDDRVKVLREWARVVRPGSIVFIVQHNLYDSDIESILRDCGWIKTDIFRDVRPNLADATSFFIIHTSG